MLVVCANNTTAGRESQLLHAFPTGKLLVRPYVFILPLCSGCKLFPSPPKSGDKRLWLSEGCGAGPNVYSTTTGIRATATVGIPIRKTPVPALRVYPVLYRSIIVHML